MDACDSLACEGGDAGTCTKQDGAWSRMKVTCAPATDPAQQIPSACESDGKDLMDEFGNPSTAGAKWAHEFCCERFKDCSMAKGASDAWYNSCLLDNCEQSWTGKMDDSECAVTHEEDILAQGLCEPEICGHPCKKGPDCELDTNCYAKPAPAVTCDPTKCQACTDDDACSVLDECTWVEMYVTKKNQVGGLCVPTKGTKIVCKGSGVLDTIRYIEGEQCKALCDSKKLEPNEDDRCVNANYNKKKKMCKLCSKVSKVKFGKSNHVAYAAVQDQEWNLSEGGIKVILMALGLFILGAAAGIAVYMFVIKKNRAPRSDEPSSPVSPSALKNTSRAAYAAADDQGGNIGASFADGKPPKKLSSKGRAPAATADV